MAQPRTSFHLDKWCGRQDPTLKSAQRTLTLVPRYSKVSIRLDWEELGTWIPLHGCFNIYSERIEREILIDSGIVINFWVLVSWYWVQVQANIVHVHLKHGNIWLHRGNCFTWWFLVVRQLLACYRSKDKLLN